MQNNANLSGVFNLLTENTDLLHTLQEKMLEGEPSAEAVQRDLDTLKGDLESLKDDLYKMRLELADLLDYEKAQRREVELMRKAVCKTNNDLWFVFTVVLFVNACMFLGGVLFLLMGK